MELFTFLIGCQPCLLSSEGLKKNLKFDQIGVCMCVQTHTQLQVSQKEKNYY